VLLAIDVGNTNVTLALFDGDRLAADWRVTSRREWTADEVATELRDLFALRDFDFRVVSGVVIASVVPTVNSALVEASRRYLKCEPVMVGPGVKTSVRIRYENPKDVGADRIANALAAFTKYGGPIVVIDFGTAVTYDAINADGDYLGGAIAPGVEISLDALVSQTAMLRRVEPVAPDSVIGRNTVASIQSAWSGASSPRSKAWSSGWSTSWAARPGSSPRAARRRWWRTSPTSSKPPTHC